MHIALVLFVALVTLRLRALFHARRLRARFARARDGERDARVLLVRRGYDVLEAQPRGAITLTVDGAASVHALRADYLVARGGRRFVAEVKTGAVAPSLDHAPTRRQILEYCAAFDVDGALLVDPESDRIREIALPAPRARRLPWIALGLVLGAALVLLGR